MSCGDQAVIELKKTVASLQDIKLYLQVEYNFATKMIFMNKSQDIMTLEERMLSALSKSANVQDRDEIVIEQQQGKHDIIIATEGETITLRCR